MAPHSRLQQSNQLWLHVLELIRYVENHQAFSLQLIAKLLGHFVSV
jgi:hypothetical protein